MIGRLTERIDRGDGRLTALVWASAVGAYLLLALGAATSVLEAGGACGTWPTCSPGLVGDLSSPQVVVALGHRLAALIVGLLFVTTLIEAVRQNGGRMIGPIAVATGLYPFQVGIGALTATGTGSGLASLHFLIGVAIFAGAILGLLWHLEATYAPSTERAVGAGSVSDDSVGTDPNPSTDTTDGASPNVDSVVTAGASKDLDLRERAIAYLRLTKPRLMWLLALVAVAAMAMVAGPDLSVRAALATVIGGVLAVGASGTFNNVLEVDRDREMDRTDDRPLVRGDISVRGAVAFGFGLTALSGGVFLVAVNSLAGILALGAIVYYSVVYTLILKPHTRRNIVLGGAVGAFPALIGGAAVTGTVPVSTVVLGFLIFLWTPAHFYNLALAYREDYAAAGFPMLSVVSGVATTRRHVVGYLGATLVAAVLLGAVTDLGWLYTGTSVLVGAAFLWAVIVQYREQTTAAAFRTFHASNAYLGTLLCAIVVESMVL